MTTASTKAMARASSEFGRLTLFWRQYSVALVATGRWHHSFANSWHAIQAVAIGFVPAMYLLTWGHDEIYTMLWALVFGFATINILSLGARSFEHRSGLNFGEILAILIVVVSVILLAWELLYYFNILPIRLEPRG